MPRLGIARSWAGTIDATPDLIRGRPVPTLRGFLFATGFSGHGFAMGPVTGRLISELIVDGKASLDISGFRFALRRGRHRQAAQVLGARPPPRGNGR